MPELPEVETIKNTLKHLVIKKTIRDVAVYWPRIIKHPDDVEQFAHLLKAQTIHDIERKGKFLLFQLDDYVLVSHLRMEGKYRVHPSDESIQKHTHIVFTFVDGETLNYDDVRKFGTMHLYQKGTELTHKPLNQLGPDPFDGAFTLDYFYHQLKRTKRTIKQVLLDQTVVAGLGNIYVDETLFRAGVHPMRTASNVTRKETASIRSAAIETLDEAVIQGGTTIRSYVDSLGDMGLFQQELFVYGQENHACKQCGKSIIKIRVSDRGTHVCPSCQK